MKEKVRIKNEEYNVKVVNAHVGIIMGEIIFGSV